MAKNDVTKAKEAQLPAEFMDALADAGQQHKDALGKDDMSVPFIQILQQLSPQCTRGKPEFIKGAIPSELLNTVTQERFPTRDDDDNQIVGMKILPISYKRTFIEWVTRANGGGIVQEYSVEEGLAINTARNDINQDIIQSGSPVGTPGNELKDTHTHFVFIMKDDGSYAPAIISMSSTQVKASKDWNAMINEVRLPDGRDAPRFFATWNVTTVQRTNDKGSWYVFKFEREGDLLTDGRMDVFKEALSFKEGIDAGEHKADHAKAEAAASGSTNPDAPSGGEGDDDVPF